MLRAIYGNDSVVSVNLSESESTKPLTPDQLRLKSLANQRLAASKNEKTERARQKMAQAQQAMQIANRARAAM